MPAPDAAPRWLGGQRVHSRLHVGRRKSPADAVSRRISAEQCRRSPRRPIGGRKLAAGGSYARRMAAHERIGQEAGSFGPGEQEAAISGTGNARPELPLGEVCSVFGSQIP